MSSQKDLDAPLLNPTKDVETPDADKKFDEYVSRAKLRANNNIKICGCIPLNYVILVCIMFITFGSYWVFDIPGSIPDQLKAWFGHGYSDGNNKILYSVYSWPNCILAFFGGFIIDKITGVRLGALIFCGLVLLGHCVFSLGVQFKSFPLAVIGRFIFGLGGESLTVAQNTYTIRWFDGDRLALAFGIVVAFSRVGTAVNFGVSPVLADEDNGVPLTVWFGAGMCFLSFLFCCFAAYLDKWGETQVEIQRQEHLASVSAEERDYIARLDAVNEPVNDDISFRRIKDIPFNAWLLYLVCMFFYMAILNFYQVAQDIFHHTGRQYGDNTASLFVAIPAFVAIPGSIFAGWVVDKVGRALYIIALACVLLVACHVWVLALAYSWTNTIPPYSMILLGLTYSLGAASLWPILAFIVNKDVLGTAYGCMTAIQNFGLAFFSLLIAELQDDIPEERTYHWTQPIFFFIGCAFIALVLNFILTVSDKSKGARLNASAVERKKQVEEEERAEAEKQEQLQRDDQQKLSIATQPPPYAPHQSHEPQKNIQYQPLA